MFKVCTYTFLVVLVANLLAACGDIAVSWPSPILPKLLSSNPEVNPLSRPITRLEESWLGSIVFIGALIGPLPFGYISIKFGRKIGLLSISLPLVGAYVILAFVHKIELYYLARFLAGLSMGAITSLLPLYVSEIAEDSNRGRLSVISNIFFTSGTLIPYILGPYLPVLWFHVIILTIPVSFFFIFILIGIESPYYLVQKKQLSKAAKSLAVLRPYSKIPIREEITKIRLTLEKCATGNLSTLLKTKSNLKATAISISLIMFNEFSGINAILSYTQLIFQYSGSRLAPEISSIIVGIIFFLSSFITPFFTEKLGRRVFLLISSTGMMFFMFVLGVYFYCKDTLSLDVSFLHWVPIFSLVFYIISFNFGYAGLSWTVCSELFSVQLKPIGTSLVSSSSFLFSFLVTKFFSDLNTSIGIAGTFGVFAGFCLAATIFVMLFVPETRGKSFIEIQDILEK